MSDTRLSADPTANGDLRNRVQQIRLDTQLGAAKTGGGRTSWLPWALCGLLALTWAGVAVRSYRNTPTDQGTDPAAGTTKKAEATPAGGKTQLEYQGYIVPASLIAVSPIDVAGRIVELNVVEGKYVPEGEVLAKIDPVSFQAIHEEAKAALTSAQAQLEGAKKRLAEMDPASVRKVEVEQVDAQIREAKAEAARADDELKRLKSVPGYSERERISSENALLGAQARVAKLTADREILVMGPRQQKLDAAQAEVAAAEANVTAAAARLVQTKWRLENCTIRAPISGTILSKKAEKGNLVNPQAFAATSGSVCEMADLSQLEVELDVPERVIGQVSVGQPCRARVLAYPDRPYTGKVDRIMPIAKRGNNTILVRVRLDIPPDEAKNPVLKPDMGAVVSLLEVEKK
jgi:multidrug resistance efflux pump